MVIIEIFLSKKNRPHCLPIASIASTTKSERTKRTVPIAYCLSKVDAGIFVDNVILFVVVDHVDDDLFDCIWY